MNERCNTNLALEQAYQEIPKAWWEVYDGDRNFVAQIIFTSLTSSILRELIKSEPKLIRLMGGILYLISAIADGVSTSKAVKAINKAESRGIEVEHEEWNPLLKGSRSPKELNFSKRSLGIQAIGLAISTSTVAAAVPFSIIKFRCSMSNLRIAKRYDRATELIDRF